MPLRLEKLAEPIPGYKLLERLGRGGFGEVWKAEAPGGLVKAIKVVSGDLGNKQPGSAAAQELQALNRVKTIRHPFLLSLERVDIVQGQLVIVMELADRDLRSRYKECKAQGLPGIPRDELLRYIEEAAEALDLMNIQHGLQHLDIKPQNLFLVYNHVKIADFGLVKDLNNMKANGEEGFTPEYTPPERARNGVSRSSDQYSLAIVYQELLTGRLPFVAGDPRQLLKQHLTQPPDVSPLPPGDRAAIARALAKMPNDRFPTCLELVRALRVGNPAAAAAFPAMAPPKGPAVKQPVQEIGLPEEIGLSPLEEERPEAAPTFSVVVDTRCPSCGHKGTVPEKFLGKTVKCRKCAKLFVITDALKGPVPAKPTLHGRKPQPAVAKPAAKAAPAAKPAPRPSPAQPKPPVEEENPFANLMEEPKRPPRQPE
jgi:serine/threonine protein kinase